ncbi:hypothetical protein [Endozoicomonas ascidiicola]|uniref:hypothetical protein n=1 Tax=Endozoicomonas ascidiicola TaxID=1698521 RepID=UPI000836A5FA|nr:hypothetical protein [Endozoicomonas ascidiicola]
MQTAADNIMMMSDKEKFYSVVNQFDFLKPFWDQKAHEIRYKSLEERLGTMSSGEMFLAKFMANVWFHQDEYPFSLIDAMGTLCGDFKEVIEDWVKSPYWP